MDSRDQDILFGLGATHYALGNFGLGNEYLGRFNTAYANAADTTDLLGRSALLACADEYLPAVLFLRFMNDQRAVPAKEIEIAARKLIRHCIHYAFNEKPVLGMHRLTLENIDPAQTREIKRLIKSLLAGFCWQDAIFLYKKCIANTCPQCPKRGKKYSCFLCVVHKAFGDLTNFGFS